MKVSTLSTLYMIANAMPAAAGDEKAVSSSSHAVKVAASSGSGAVPKAATAAGPVRLCFLCGSDCGGSCGCGGCGGCTGNYGGSSGGSSGGCSGPDCESGSSGSCSSGDCGDGSGPVIIGNHGGGGGMQAWARAAARYYVQRAARQAKQ